MAMLNLSTTITLGGTAQTFSAARAGNPRKGWSIYNSSAGNLYVNDIGGTASVSDGLSYTVVSGALLAINPQALESVSQSAISIVGATTGQTCSRPMRRVLCPRRRRSRP